MLLLESILSPCFQPNAEEEEDAAVSWIRCETAGLMVLGYLLGDGQNMN